MGNSIYIVSDNHFSMEKNDLEKSRRNKLFKVFDKIKYEYSKQKNKNCNVIIGGDFFDYWFEYKHVIPSGYDTILESLKQLTSSGIQVHFIAGNHDYWDFGYLNKTTGINFYKNNFEFTFNNEKILLTHGDGLLKKDYGYKMLKKIIRSNIFINLFKLLPPNLTCSLAKKISKSSSEYNHHDKYVNTIKNDIGDYAKKQWNKGYDTVLVGHYHQTGIISKNNKKLIYLGDWLSKFTVTALVNKKYWQGNWKEFLDF